MTEQATKVTEGEVTDDSEVAVAGETAFCEIDSLDFQNNMADRMLKMAAASNHTGNVNQKQLDRDEEFRNQTTFVSGLKS
jgi:ADP-ribosylglycohydrolase